MLNLAGRRAFVFSRPFSIFAAEDRLMSFLYRVVGRATAAMAELGDGETMVMLGPLGRPFPAPDPDRRAVLVAGGVGLPPVHSWWARYRRPGDAAFFGGRDGADVPWGLLDESWGVSVDDPGGVPAGREAFHGLVTQLVESRPDLDRGPAELFACGPEPLLKAAGRLAADRSWRGWLSLEEHMGCGYGACKGCVVAVRDEERRPGAWRTATCCLEGPVFAAEDIVWDAATAPHAGGEACDAGGAP
jgi:dihydroorotate dehydrogenase electron transfer subunit